MLTNNRFIYLLVSLIYSSIFNVTFCVSEQESLQKLLDERNLLGSSEIKRILDGGGVTVLKDNEVSSPCSKITIEPSSTVKKYLGASIIWMGFL